MFKNSLKNIFSVLYKNAITILVIATLCVVLSVGYFSMHYKAKYHAESEVLFHSYTLSELPNGAMAEPKKPAIETSLEIFNSQRVFKYLSESELLTRKLSPEELDEMIDVKRKSRDSLVLIIEITCDDEDVALELAEKFPTAMRNTLSSFTGDFNITPLTIDPDAELYKPSTLLIALISFTFGAVLGAIAVLIFDKMNRKLRGAGDYRARYSAPLLGTVPDFSAKNKEEK